MRINLLLVLPLLAGLTACGNRPATETAGENPEGAQPEQAGQPAPRGQRAQRAKQAAGKSEKALETRTREGQRGGEASRAAAPAVTMISIPAGSEVSVQLDQALSTAQNKAGDTFAATLMNPVLVDGRPAIPKGTRFSGTVVTADASGRLKGVGVLAMRLDSFVLNGQTYRIETAEVSQSSGGHKKRNVGLIGGGAGLGAVLGAIAGGGKGAAIGAAAGAGAGTAGAAATGKQQVSIPAETGVVFTLRSPVSVKG
jgi:hypothetical protein